MQPPASPIDVKKLSDVAFNSSKEAHKAKNTSSFIVTYCYFSSKEQHNSNNNDTHTSHPYTQVPLSCLPGGLAFAWFLAELPRDSPLRKNPDEDIDTREGDVSYRVN